MPKHCPNCNASLRVHKKARYCHNCQKELISKPLIPKDELDMYYTFIFVFLVIGGIVTGLGFGINAIVEHDHKLSTTYILIDKGIVTDKCYDGNVPIIEIDYEPYRLIHTGRNAAYRAIHLNQTIEIYVCTWNGNYKIIYEDGSEQICS